MKWPKHSLQDVAEINPRRPSITVNSKTPVSFVPMQAISEITAEIHGGNDRPYNEVSRGFTYLKTMMSYLLKSHRAWRTGSRLWLVISPMESGSDQLNFHVLRPKVGLLPEYLHYFIRQQAFRDAARSTMRGAAGQQRVPKSFLEETNIPLPPLSEQQRIVEILDQADALRKKRAKANQLAERIVPALFYKMFGDPATNPMGLRKTRLGDLLKVRSGAFLPAKSMATDGKYPVYGGNGINGYHSEYMFDSPKIVLGRVGAYCGVVHYTEPKCWVTDNALFVAEQSDDLTDGYLTEALRMAKLNQYAGRAGQPLISGNRIYPIEILVPGKPAQEKFERCLHQLQRDDVHRLNSAKQIDTIFHALIHRAFSGDLTAKWRDAHMKEFLQEMEQQAKVLGVE